MKAIIDKEICIGCGLCPQVCPRVFNMADDGIAAVIADPVPVSEADCSQSAAAQCPVAAISFSLY